MNQIRQDILHGVAGAGWTMESARARIYGRWGADEHRERCERRLQVLEKAIERAGFRLPAECLDGYVDWAVSLVGAEHPHPLGPAVLRRYGQVVDVHASSFVDDVAAFAALGTVTARVPTADTAVPSPEPLLGERDPGSGRRVVVLNDLHIGERGADDVARTAVAQINALEPDVVLVAGDITDDGEPEQFALAKQILDGLRAPWHAVLGNHDAVQRSTRLGNGRELFTEAFGVPPDDVVLDVGDVQIALVDSSDPTPWPFVDLALESGRPQPAVGGTASGAYDPGQVDALAARLDPSRPALVVQHHELQPFCGHPPFQFAVREQDSNVILDALSGHRVLGFVGGHTHRSALVTARATSASTEVPFLEVPALKEWPLAFTVLAVDGPRVRATVHQVADHDLVADRYARMNPVMLAYTLGPLTSLDATFEPPST